MTLAYVVESGFLVSHRYAQDGMEELQAKPGQNVVIGDVRGYQQQPLPHSGAKWHVRNQAWLDSAAKKQQPDLQNANKL